MVDQTTAAACSLRGETDQLAALVGKFQTEGRDDANAPIRRPLEDRRLVA